MKRDCHLFNMVLLVQDYTPLSGWMKCVQQTMSRQGIYISRYMELTHKAKTQNKWPRNMELTKN